MSCKSDYNFVQITNGKIRGAPGGTRTPNPRIRSAMLYPLSYGRMPMPGSMIPVSMFTQAATTV
jgi:hypothetical protein